jgi:hypothetical protein
MIRYDSQKTANHALHLTAYSLRFAALRSGFRQQVSAGVRLPPYKSCVEGNLSRVHSVLYDAHEQILD